MNLIDTSVFRSCGADVRISDTAFFRYPELVSIGNHVAIDGFVYITTELVIHDYVHIGPHCSIIGGSKSKCVFMDFSGIAAGCRVICGSDDYTGSGLTNPTVPTSYHADLHFSSVIFEKHSLLGTNTVVHPGITLGEGATVGSCSLVTRNLLPWMIYKGIPARPSKEREKKKILAFEKKLREDLG